MSAPGLDAPALERLWREARRARERRGAAGDAVVRLARLRADEAAAIDGLPWPGRSHVVLPGDDLRRPLSRLEAAVREAGDELLAVLERHGGPVRDLPAERRAAKAARSDLFASLDEIVEADGREPLREWLEHVRRHGLLATGDGARARAALAAVAGLPTHETVDRAVFAARTCAGDSHALDSGTALERMLRGILQWLDDSEANELGALEVRRLYERFGIELDPTSATVLTIGLPGEPDSACGRLLMAASGAPLVLTYGQLRDAPPRWPRGLAVFVCENPSVVHHAYQRLGRRCAPLVCTAGWPGSAVQLLLASLRGAGATLAHHADFDREGVAMHRHLADGYGARPWRFGSPEYRAAAAGRTLPPLGGQNRDPSNDPLGRAMDELDVQVVEELVLDELLADLDQVRPRPSASACRDEGTQPRSWGTVRFGETGPHPR